VVVLGSGGNIGSHLVPQLGRMRLARLVLCEPDSYDRSNLATQDITTRDVGRLKVVVQRERLRRIDPDLEVVTHPVRFETLPIGWLRGDVLLAALDSRGGRLRAGEAAALLGMRWVDAGVRGDGLLARVSVFGTGSDAACLECAFGEDDYAALQPIYDCDGEARVAPATGAPASLGALAASLQALECGRLLSGDESGVGREVLVDALHQTHYSTRLDRNPNCRFHHRALPVEPGVSVDDRLSLEQALRLHPGGGEAVGVVGHRFVIRLRCAACAREEPWLGLRRSPGSPRRRCRKCRGELVATGFDTVERLQPTMVTERWLGQTLSRLGVRAGDVLAIVGPGGERYYEVGEGAEARTRRRRSCAGRS